MQNGNDCFMVSLRGRSKATDEAIPFRYNKMLNFLTLWGLLRWTKVLLAMTQKIYYGSCNNSATLLSQLFIASSGVFFLYNA